MNWKVIAIVFIILFALETAWLGFGLYILMQEEAEAKECWYEICGEYPEALVENGVCFCYDYDVLGDYIIVKTEVMK